MKHVLVTGAFGLVGCAVVAAFDAQRRLRFQEVSWPEMIAEIRANLGRRRYLLRLAAPLVHAVLERRAPYRQQGKYTHVWQGVRERWGDSALV